MIITKRLLLSISLLCFSYITFAQNLNLRKAILKSDFIFASNDYKYDTIFKNDYTTENYILINKIDTILKNRLSSIPKKLTVRNYRDGEDFYSSLLTNRGGCVQEERTSSMQEVYNNVFFVQKIGKEYQIIVFLNDIKYKPYSNYIRQIQSIKNIEQIKDLKTRFDKTLDWFIDNGFIPDQDFIEYYKNKDITTDSIQYSEKQYQNALIQFEKGEEELLPMVKSKYKDNVRNYFAKKLETILEKDKLDYSDYFEFYHAVYTATNYFDNDYDSTDNLLNDNLTSDKFEEYDKKKIMKHLLETVKKWE